MKSIPKYLFKYKSISSLEDVERFLNIIKNNRIYYPTYKQLNDPLEGAGFNINIPGWAGIGIHRAADVELPPIEELKMEYGILSLSDCANSPQLWAHYANNYKGVCLCLKTDGLLSNANKVIYSDNRDKTDAFEDDIMRQAVLDNLYIKQLDWAYEHEWRDIRKIEDGEQFFSFGSDELAGVIIGKSLLGLVGDMLVKEIPKGVKVIKAIPGYQTFRINLLPYSYEIEYDGSEPEYIRDLTRYLGGD